jgi:hypothetical protein
MAAFVLVSAALLVLSGQSGDVDVESSLTAAGVLIGSCVVGSYYVRASAATTAVPVPSAVTPPRRRTSMQKDGGATPDSDVSENFPFAAGTRSSAGGELTIAGCALLPLSAVDRTVLASAGDLDCDCTFLDVRVGAAVPLLTMRFYSNSIDLSHGFCADAGDGHD